MGPASRSEATDPWTIKASAWPGANELLSVINEAINKEERIFPLPPIPAPPEPRKRGGRYRKAVATWRRGQELLERLNDLFAGPHSSGGGNLSVSRFEDPAPSRVRFSEGRPAHLRAWTLILKVAQGLNASRRLSEEKAETGVALWTLLRKGVADIYGRVGSKRDKYKDFVADLIIELPKGSPVVEAVIHLPTKVATDLQNPQKLVRQLDAEEQEEFEALMTKYDHLRGSRKNGTSTIGERM
jgi:hypothetical protein